jgi:hypothetical protein
MAPMCSATAQWLRLLVVWQQPLLGVGLPTAVVGLHSVMFCDPIQ